jgi:hypothetical protein
MARHEVAAASSLESVIAADAWARGMAIEGCG